MWTRSVKPFFYVYKKKINKQSINILFCTVCIVHSISISHRICAHFTLWFLSLLEDRTLCLWSSLVRNFGILLFGSSWFIPSLEHLCIYIYKVVISVCLFVCPIRTSEPHWLTQLNFDWWTRQNQRNVLSLV